MLYVGIDLHRRTSRIVTMDPAGAVKSQRTVSSDRVSLEDAFSRIERPAEAVFEATWGWGWLADLLEEMGIPAHMAHPLQTRAISAARVKNDAIDARTLAHLLRTNMVPSPGSLRPRFARRAARCGCALPWDASERGSNSRSMRCSVSTASASSMPTPSG